MGGGLLLFICVWMIVVDIVHVLWDYYKSYNLLSKGLKGFFSLIILFEWPKGLLSPLLIDRLMIIYVKCNKFYSNQLNCRMYISWALGPWMITFRLNTSSNYILFKRFKLLSKAMLLITYTKRKISTLASSQAGQGFASNISAS